jgi:predicted transcriptional regulator
MADEFLTVAEVAELLKLNEQTVRNMVDRGDLPAGPCRDAACSHHAIGS